MKNYLAAILLLSLSASGAYAQPSPAPAKEVVRNACVQAAREHKNVFLIFHASWCGWCRRMDSIMSAASCRRLFTGQYVICHLYVKETPDKLHLVNPGAEDLLKQYRGDDQGIPYWVILDKGGKLLADSRIKPEGAGPDGSYPNAGCPDKKDEVAYFVRVLKETSALKERQLNLIAQNFQRK